MKTNNPEIIDLFTRKIPLQILTQIAVEKEKSSRIKHRGIMKGRFDPYQIQYPSDIARKIRVTYSHTVNVLKKLTEYGLVTSIKSGRLRSYKITKKGKRLISALYELQQI